MQIAEGTQQEKTGLGNYFIANYPPFSFWNANHLAAAYEAMQSPPKPGTPLGLYLHIPFCRKRCKFCYFRVYTDKNARDVESYLNALIKEVELLAKQPIVGGRQLDYVYFGGGTPSYLSATQLRGLMERLKQILPWDAAREVTFECEPGTLQLHKLQTLKELGVTRLSLGIENFSDAILESNGRAHLSAEIYRAFGWARETGFQQINIDLIAGMVGETWDNWKECIAKTIELGPESVTIYQMELPYNTVFSKELHVIGQESTPSSGVADWPTKRAWVDYAFTEFRNAGYDQSSAYTVVKNKAQTQFVYRDALWHGADMFGTGVASFGHVNGVHIQNVDTWEKYLEKLEQNELPLGRALPVNSREQLIREMILQLKTGSLERKYFQMKFGEDILEVFRDGYQSLANDGWLTLHADGVTLTPKGFLQVDRLLPTFFEERHRSSRYT
ncbi:coproporphyrinogen-III oxidase family protein [Tuwongella immobilis]|uniref:Radical SAM core domain-containing protein n=1 Tax=Tuwongella immobilis TaxID=692036 RepID=A0A6C2YUF6_9BACT|nr:coproporphyrinogen-III oxidase family protein [Tuwongella immobilis]VIP04669.1 coproporphyrinogen iii oxidase : Coproporphyrinogen dehydrogenase OS=Pirellula staleyi (strain ATCC 27377 / DSM 6068 / ICPB 4128) GN=Psta_4503 PE=4 SV=1: Radical_SAM: HemN_C [Tuwongella immobilis]VTS06698.1 coproporphyrinogen iii oxidase : Coproporphyrinogen dehydrogenase OS=Pirellula staleyi (strain ATCC 27377 / DSM 6068 / ICPB 4128) GN=Psta_4503 PE=4 SV=1: Radical_SAM: HemN_C [Tuwongella immobilis]